MLDTTNIAPLTATRAAKAAHRTPERFRQASPRGRHGSSLFNALGVFDSTGRSPLSEHARTWRADGDVRELRQQHALEPIFLIQVVDRGASSACHAANRMAIAVLGNRTFDLHRQALDGSLGCIRREFERFGEVAINDGVFRRIAIFRKDAHVRARHGAYANDPV